MLDFGALLKALLAAFLHPPPVPPVVTPPSNPPTNPNGPHWYDKYAPVKGQPVTPPAPTPVPNPVPSLVDTVAGIMLGENHKIPFILGITEYKVPIKGVTIHKIDEATAQKCAQIVIANSTPPGEGDSDPFPLSYALACLLIEGAGDPGCVNLNTGPGRSNPTGDPAGGDYGFCQLKAKYLIGQSGITTVDEAIAFALDPAKAIPYFVRVMREHLAQADALALPANTNPVYLSRWAQATIFYNFGLTGGTKLMTENAPLPSHVLHVAHYDYAFAKTLGVAPVMPLGL